MASLRAISIADFLPAYHLFHDRTDAGARLAEGLDVYRGRDALVLGIPRGGVPVAAAVARRLGAELDVVVARKLGAPGQPELAIGAVTADGGRVLIQESIRALQISEAYLTEVTGRETAQARRSEVRYRGGRPAPRARGRTVILVDDGVATGATMRAAVRSVRLQAPARLVVAVPVGARRACAELRAEADIVAALYEPDPFLAVGLHYGRFEVTDDAEVCRPLEEARAPVRTPSGLARAT